APGNEIYYARATIKDCPYKRRLNGVRRYSYAVACVFTSNQIVQPSLSSKNAQNTTRRQAMKFTTLGQP
ncbi:hypothetical protein, partial [uncultured Microscilla sp.]|uniref:hypothetical protein n=1 Tax=uncultured Microscilla sp. TaxID=432653 RepID=UPI00261DA7C5